MSFTLEKLRVYQKSVEFADTITALTESFPRGYYYLTDQLNRDSLSVPGDRAECRAGVGRAVW